MMTATKTNGQTYINLYNRYMNGDCYLLALAIAEQTGWDVVLVTDDRTESGHAMCRLPNGRLADVRGIHEADDLRAHCPLYLDGNVILSADRHRKAGLPEPEMVPWDQAGWWTPDDPGTQARHDAQMLLKCWGMS